MSLQSQERTSLGPVINRRTALFWLTGSSVLGVVTVKEIETFDCTRERTGFSSYPREEMLPQIRTRALVKNPNITDIESLDDANLKAAQQKWRRTNSGCRVMVWRSMGENLFNNARRFVRW